MLDKEEQPPLKKIKRENAFVMARPNEQLNLKLLPELLIQSAGYADADSVLNLSYTCKLFHDDLPKYSMYWCARIAAICERKPSLEQQENVARLQKIYTAHRENIKKARDYFFSEKNQHFAPSKIDLEKIDKNDPFLRKLCTIMMLIARQGYFRLFEEMMAAIDHCAINRFVNKNSETPLFIAARHGHVKTFLLMAKYNKNWPMTATPEDFLPYITSDPLHNLVLFGHEAYLVESCQHLLAIPEYHDTYSMPDACLDVIYNRDFAKSYSAAIKNSFTDLDAHINLIDYAKASDNLGWSVLHWAACLDKLVYLQKIKALGIDLNLENHDGMTALYFACIKNHAACVKFLLDNGARMQANPHRIMYCNHPLHMAAYHNSTAALQVLLNHIHRNVNNDADRNLIINYEDENQETALHMACDQNNSDCVRLLVDAGLISTLLIWTTIQRWILPKIEIIRSVWKS